jgi:hypothetical protein
MRPEAFGTSEYTSTNVPAAAFVPADSSQESHTSGSLGRFGTTNAEQHFYASADIPAGAVIDFIGFSNLNDGEANVMALHLRARGTDGSLTELVAVDNTPHTNWQVDGNANALGILWAGGFSPLILDIEIVPNPNLQFFGSVTIMWKRTVTPAPGFATFNDVPTSHPFHQYVEALSASGITAGCQANPPLYCPDSPVTRGQMAVFLAKALGLNWPL